MEFQSEFKNYEFELVQNARCAYEKGKTLPYEFRMHQLKAIYQMLVNHQDEFVKSLAQDLQKPRFESILAEIEFAKNDAKSQMLNLKSYIAKQHKEKDLVSMFDEVYVQSEPLGVVLIIGTWNYAIQVNLCPLIGAIAAGNCAIVKCSELAPHTGHLLESLCKRYLDNDCYYVLNGQADVCKRLLEIKFDHIFFTGSKRVGRIIYQKAAEQFTTCTLELGGKSPVYVDKNLSIAAMERACARLIWGKMMNSGQTCVAPDYIILHENVHELFVTTFKKVYSTRFYKRFYDKLTNTFNYDINNLDKEGIPIDSIGQLLNKEQFARLSKLIEQTKGQIIFGGHMNKHKNQISMTLVDNVQLDDVLMQDEIFGPIFPIVSVKNEFEAINLIKQQEKPLALYVFSEKQSLIDSFLLHTSSGTVCVNDCILQLNVESLPFGGVGESGSGCYHGRYSFETFSHQKPVLRRSFNPILEWVASKRYPPYRMNYLRRLIRLTTKRWYPLDMQTLKLIFMFFFGFLFCMVYQIYIRKYFQQSLN